MKLLTKLESRLGLTRADVTVALFLSATALTGFAYTQFFDQGRRTAHYHDLLALQRHYDSVMNARQQAQTGSVGKALALLDSAGYPGDDAALPEGVARELEKLRAEESSAKEQNKQQQADSEQPGTEHGFGTKALPTQPLDLNNASLQQLQKLPGVGQSTAEKIVAYRMLHPFTRIEDVMEVKGIGQAKFLKMKPFIVVLINKKTSDSQ